jgi:hypothetical protein
MVPGNEVTILTYMNAILFVIGLILGIGVAAIGGLVEFFLHLRAKPRTPFWRTPAASSIRWRFGTGRPGGHRNFFHRVREYCPSSHYGGRRSNRILWRVHFAGWFVVFH